MNLLFITMSNADSLNNNLDQPDETTALLQQVAAGQLSVSDCQKILRKNKIDKDKPLHLKVTDKGCVGIYGMRRMPITLYVDELQRLLDFMLTNWSFNEETQQWLEYNNTKLKHK
jgi:hypothetical protein